jgi:hypothetical protein
MLTQTRNLLQNAIPVPLMGRTAEQLVITRAQPCATVYVYGRGKLDEDSSRRFTLPQSLLTKAKCRRFAVCFRCSILVGFMRWHRLSCSLHVIDFDLKSWNLCPTSGVTCSTQNMKKREKTSLCTTGTYQHHDPLSLKSSLYHLCFVRKRGKKRTLTTLQVL